MSLLFFERFHPPNNCTSWFCWYLILLLSFLVDWTTLCSTLVVRSNKNKVFVSADKSQTNLWFVWDLMPDWQTVGLLGMQCLATGFLGFVRVCFRFVSPVRQQKLRLTNPDKPITNPDLCLSDISFGDVTIAMIEARIKNSFFVGKGLMPDW